MLFCCKTSLTKVNQEESEQDEVDGTKTYRQMTYSE